jgi:hypothetical protein
VIPLRSNVIVLKFRPSSHSEDGSVVGTFKDAEEAKAAARRARDRLRCSCRAYQNRAVAHYGDGEDGCLEKTRRFMRKAGAIKTTVHREECEQFLDITIRLPNGITRKTVPVVLDKDTQDLIKVLSFLPCQKIETKTHALWTYHYAFDELHGNQPRISFYANKSGDRQFDVEDDAGYRVIKAGKNVEVRGLW